MAEFKTKIRGRKLQTFPKNHKGKLNADCLAQSREQKGGSGSRSEMFFLKQSDWGQAAWQSPQACRETPQLGPGRGKLADLRERLGWRVALGEGVWRV